MKLKTLLLAACAVVGLSASALPNTSATDSLYIADFTIAPGDTVVVPVHFKNATAYCAMQCNIYLTAPLKLVPISSKTIAGQVENTWVEGVGRSIQYQSDGFVEGYSTYVPNDQELRIVGFQNKNVRVLEVDATGEPIFNFKVTLPADAKAGETYPGRLEKVHYSTGLVDQSADGDGPNTKFVVTSAATAVKNVTTAKAVKSVRYYNVAGMESAEPFNGVNIVVTNYTDGTKSTTKVIK